MKPSSLQLQGTTKADRHETIQRVKEAILNGGGFILDFQMFSNMAICINFEVSAGSIGKLQSSLAREAVLNKESLDKLANCCRQLEQLEEMAQDADVKGSLNITFIHNEPDLIIKAPPIPG